MYTYVRVRTYRDHCFFLLLFVWLKRGLASPFVASGASHSERSEPKRAKRAKAPAS